MKTKTFNDWSKAGYKIIKGSKSESRNADGIPLFIEKQVIPAPRTAWQGYYNIGDEEQDDGYWDYAARQHQEEHGY